MYRTDRKLLRCIGFILFMLFPLGLSQPGKAGDLRDLTTLEVARLSSRIVFAKCRSSDVREVTGGNIFTFSEFDVFQTVKGSFPKDRFILRLLGGRIGNVEVDAPFTPRFTPGKEVVLFLGRDNADGYPTIFPQGVFEVCTKPKTEEKIVVPNPTDIPLFHARDNTAYSTLPKFTPLEDFLFSIGKLR